ncbi:MAG: hypothetical protein KAJ63_02040 [Methyloprofundus sp.]|nr:hypothetical protein [Methyloprofundus sp.]
MQTNQPDFNQLLTDWYSLALENPLFVGAIVFSVLLLTVLFYTIKIVFLNKKRRATEKEGVKLRGLLEESEQQTVKAEEKLRAMTEQLEKDQQQAAEQTAKAEERNQQVVDNIKQLAQKFNLSEQLVASDTKPKAEFIWQQQDNIQMQLGERLQAESEEKNTLKNSYDQEKEQFGKQKILAEQLQKTLEMQTSKSEQLERELGTHKLIQLQQKNQAEQALADAVAGIQAKHELAIAALVNEVALQKERLVAVAEDKPVVVEDKPVVIEDEPVVVEGKATAVEDEPVVIEDEPVVVEDEAPVNNVVLEEPAPKVTEQIIPAVVEVPEAEALEQEEPDYIQSNLDIAGKFKSLFGKSKAKAETSEQAMDIEVPEVAEPEFIEPTPEPEIELKPEYEEPKSAIGGKLKSLNPFAKAKKQADIPEADELESEPEYNKSDLDISGKFKKLNPFAKRKEKLASAKPVQQAEESVTEAIVSVAEIAEAEEEQELEPDYAESNFKMPAKLKGLFGKG